MYGIVSEHTSHLERTTKSFSPLEILNARAVIKLPIIMPQNITSAIFKINIDFVKNTEFMHFDRYNVNCNLFMTEFTAKGKSAGFAMLEVLIAMIVITTLLSTLVIPGMTINNYQKRKATHNKMQHIQRALNQHLLAFGRLPCPVKPDNSVTVNYAEAVSSNVCDASVPRFNSGTVLYGAVPAQTLGLSQDYVQDGWGNKIIYVVPYELTYKPSTTSPAQDAVVLYNQTNASYTIPQTTMVSGILYYTNSADFSNYLITAYKSGGSDYIRNANNIYVLLSYGENGYGAYTITGTQNSTSSADSTIGENSNIFTASKANNIIYTNPSRSSKGGKLDDIVYETSILDIINAGGTVQDSIHCDYRYTPYINATAQPSPQAAATLDSANNRYSTLQYYVPNAEVMIWDGCAVGCTSSTTSTRKYIKCLSGGSWTAVYTKTCTC